MPELRELATGVGAAELESNADVAMLADPSLDSTMSPSPRPALGLPNVASEDDSSFEERLNMSMREGQSRWEAITQMARGITEADMRLMLSACQSLTCKLHPAGAFGSLLQNMLNLILLGVIWLTMCGDMLPLRFLLRVSFYFTGCSHHMPLQRCLLLIQLPQVIVMGLAYCSMWAHWAHWDHWPQTFQNGLLQSLQRSRMLWLGFLVSSCVSLVTVVHIHLMASRSLSEGCPEGSPPFAYWYSMYLGGAESLSIVCSTIKLLSSYGFLKVRIRTSRLSSLKVIEYSQELFGDASGECCICLSHFSPTTQLLQTPCNHIMHRECLERWFEKSSLCPLCRTDVETASF